MEYEWDEPKRLRNINLHHFDFLDAVDILERAHVLSEGHPGDNGEVRHLATGKIGKFYATVVFTIREESYRIISLRRARDNERRKYDEKVHE